MRRHSAVSYMIPVLKKVPYKASNERNGNYYKNNIDRMILMIDNNEDVDYEDI